MGHLDTSQPGHECFMRGEERGREGGEEERGEGGERRGGVREGRKRGGRDGREGSRVLILYSIDN